MNKETLNHVQTVYMIGIGGVSMSSLAKILHERGVEVRGYDRTLSGSVAEMTEMGMKITSEDDPSMFEGVDLICYTAAVGPEHPQMVLAKNSGAEMVSRAELLGCIAASYENSIAVAGTHGKSTTSGMLSHLFLQSKTADPTVIVGANIPEIHSAYRIGTDRNFIFEACEYKDSFLSFYPRVAVVLNVRLDHTDYFHSMEQMIGSFRQFLSNSGKDGFGVVNLDCENCRIASKGYEGTLVTFSAEGNPDADYVARNIDLSNGFGKFDVYEKGEFLLHAELSVPGIHNVSNALAAVAASRISGMKPEEISEGLHTYRGVSRRFEYLGSYGGARFFDDYAHHPDEIAATLKAAKALTENRVICVFQPHNYSRLRDLFDDFRTSFGDADELIFTKLYAAREKAGEEVSSSLLAEQLGAVYIENMDDILPYLYQKVLPGDTILIMGAGDIEKVAENFKKSAENS